MARSHCFRLPGLLSRAALVAWLTAAAVTAGTDEHGAAPDSPRAAVQHFIELGAEARYDEAGRLLQLPPDVPPSDAPRLARRLRFVVDHYLWLDLSQLSGESEGKLDDGLTPDTEEIGIVRRASGVGEPVRLVRVEDEAGGRWLFSAATVEQVDRWFGRLKDRWIIEHLPAALLAPAPLGLLWWQWLALPLFLLVSWFAGFFLARITRSILGRLVARTRATWDDAVLARIGGPLTLAWLLAVFFMLLPLLGLAAPEQEVVRQVLSTGLFAVVLWALLRSVDVVVQIVERSPWTSAHPAATSLIPLGGRVAKVVVFILVVLTALSAFGLPVGSLLAGLGIGGLALALAAQKSVENLVGAFSIGVDQAFKEGDLIKIGEHTGHVEAIGLRSTRIRTLDRTLVTIPNAQMAEQRIESFAPRDRIRLAITVGVTYGTTRAQMLDIVAGFERVMRGHPRIWPDTVVVRFSGLGESSLDIEVMCWGNTAEIDQFRDFRQDVLLGFMEVVEKAGSGFAFPTRTVHLVEEAGKEAKARG
jgi:MscS family membrane protein